MGKFLKWLGRGSSIAILGGMGYIGLTYDEPALHKTPGTQASAEQKSLIKDRLSKADTKTRPKVTDDFADAIAVLEFSGLPATPTLPFNDWAKIAKSFTNMFGAASLAPLPPKPDAVAMADYAYNKDSIPLNPYLIKALDEDLQAREYLRLIKQEAAENGLDWRMCANQLFRESMHFDPDVINGTKTSDRGAIGIAQFIPAKAAEYGYTTDDLKDPAKSIKLYARHMADLKAQYNGDIQLALMAYNAGEGSVSVDDKGNETRDGVVWIQYKTDADPKSKTPLDFLKNRREELGNKASHAYHVETLKYVESILGLDKAEWDHPEWFESQNQKFNDPYFVGGLIDESHALSVMYPAYQEPEQPPSALAVLTSIRPKARPDHLKDSFAATGKNDPIQDAVQEALAGEKGVPFHSLRPKERTPELNNNG